MRVDAAPKHRTAGRSMISPETFARTYTRRAADVIRVSLERSGVIGFIDIHDATTLLDARSVITENVENASPAFQFVLDDGVPVSARQETTQKISYFYPCVKIRECTPRALKPASTAAASRAMTPQSDESAALNNDGYGNAMEKICVQNGAGDECLVWISEEYTFQQLRRDACRYWNLPAAHVALTDAEGYLWPEQAKILAMVSVGELHRKRVVVDYRNGASGSGGSGTGLGNTGVHHRAKQLARTQSLSTSRTTASFNRHSARASLRSDSNNAKMLMWPSLAITASADAAATTSTTPRKSPVEELWLVFTFYCVNGDSLELECIKAHQFNKLFGGPLTPAMADIIYTSEAKGKPQSSGKMNYDEFLNALLKISAAKHKQTNSSSKQASLRETSGGETLFQKLVVDSILPLAARWPTHVWEMHTQQLRKPEIVLFVSKFLEPLLEIFMFYAKSHLVNPTRGGVKELYMSYADYQRFFNDFTFANLQFSSVDAAQVFLASCSSLPFHDTLSLSTLTDASGAGGDSESLGASAAGDTTMLNSALSFVGAASIRRILESIEGVVTYAFPETQIGRICMGVSAFLDPLGRIGLTAFARLHAIKTIHCVKAVFHHVSRGLTRSRVHEILNNYSSTSIHATKFYSGTVAFNNKFLDMWRYEGSPDYLSGSLYSPLDAAVKDSKAPTGLSGNSMMMASSMASGAPTAPGIPGSPLHSPARRMMTTTSAFEDRSIPSGPGKGREALDRLVRNAFLRTAVDTVSAGVNPSANRSSGSATGGQLDGSLSIMTELEPSRGARDHFMKSPSDGDGDTAQPIDVGMGENAQKNDANKDVEVHPGDLAGDSFRTSTPDNGATHLASSANRVSAPSFASSPCSGNLQGRVPPSGGAPAHHGTAAVAVPSLVLLHHQHREDERGLFESILLKGGVLKKYGQWGNPHRRYIWCAKDFDAVFWRPLNRKNHLSKEGIAVAGIIAVPPGNSPRTRCFSVVAEDRRLDLEADSEAVRDLWANAFLYLMKEYRPRMLVA